MIFHPLTNITELKRTLGKYGVVPSRSMGQNFLICNEVIDAILIALHNAPRRVTELGAGAGTLTQALAAAGFTVRAIEKDDDLARIIPCATPKTFQQRVTVVHKDLRDTRWEWNAPYAIVGNIPYNLSGLVIRRLVQANPVPHIAVIVVQKEVGQRMTAQPPSMNLLALTTQLWGTVQTLLTIPPNCFWPQPNISSQLLTLLPHAKQSLDVQERENVLRVAKLFFQTKRKQIGSTIKREFSCDPRLILSTIGIESERRPQELTVGQWIQLAEEIKKLTCDACHPGLGPGTSL